jgi:O-antigen/teichoic acid export membrane protein
MMIIKALRKANFAVHSIPNAETLVRYAIAVAGQSALSLFNFVLNIVLVRELTAHTYGTYALSFVLASFAYTLNGSLASGPLMVFGMGRQGRPSRKAVEALLSAVNTAMVGAIFLTAVPLFAALSGEDLLVCLTAAMFIAAYAARMFTRTFAYARQRPDVALRGDLSSIFVASTSLAAVAHSAVGLTLPAVLLAIASGNTVAMAMEIYLLRLGLRLRYRPAFLWQYLPIWRHVRWSLLGASSSLLQGQAHSLLVSLTYGPAAFAPLAAGQVIFGPVRLIMNACHYVIIPDVVAAVCRDDHYVVARILKYSALVLTILVLGLGVVVALLWTDVFDLLYVRKYADEPMGMIVAIWCAIVVCSALYFAPSGILQALRKYRLLAFGTVYGCLISSAVVIILLTSLGPEWSLLGVLAGEAFTAQYTIARANRSTSTLAREKPA